MRQANIYVDGIHAGILTEQDARKGYAFEYLKTYDGAPVSLTMPVAVKSFRYTPFPPFFDGVLPEGLQLEALLRQAKLDRTDYFGQLVTVGADLVGAVTVKKIS